MFEDRKDAGKKPASVLMKYKGKDVLVLAIPCGGIEVAMRISMLPGCPLIIRCHYTISD